MSWSVSAKGKPAAVAKEIEQRLAQSRCSEPEEGIKNSVGAVIATALAAFPADKFVSVEASGSQTAEVNNKFTNSLRVEITPLYGFVE